MLAAIAIKPNFVGPPKALFHMPEACPAFYFIRSAMTRFTSNVFLSRNRVSPKEAFEGLELCKGNFHAQFLEGWTGAIPSGYSVARPESTIGGTLRISTHLAFSDMKPGFIGTGEMTSSIVSGLRSSVTMQHSIRLSPRNTAIAKKWAV